jgi:hypothetical protein
MFADVTLLFFKANAAQASVIKDVINTYERGTGQLLNPGKCSIMFNEKGDPGCQEQVREIHGVERTSFEPKYLGLPMPSGRIKGARFQSLKETR